MSGWPTVALGDVMVKRAGSVDPSKWPDELFDLYSIPAFDRGEPDVVQGSDIGSTKQLVNPGDVLLSRIVPHIRRAWVVGKQSGRRLIASGEWMVFRSSAIYPGWLRHVLVGDLFHAQLMQTVAGVGGSLMRARPAHVSSIEIPLPPIEEQRRIAAILDHADALRAKRREALARLDELTQSIFIDMFGDYLNGRRNCVVRPLSEVVRSGTIVTYGIVQAGDEYPGGVPYIRTGDIVNGEIVKDALRRTDPSIAAKYERSTVRRGDIVMSIRATVGTTAMVDDELDGANLTQGTARIAPGDVVDGTYLLEFLRNAKTQHWISRQVKGATFREITLSRLRQLSVVLPPLDLQREYANHLVKLAAVKSQHRTAIVESDALFASLQSRAFRGEL